jgi:hypothetical protein
MSLSRFGSASRKAAPQALTAALRRDATIQAAALFTAKLSPGSWLGVTLLAIQECVTILL